MEFWKWKPFFFEKKTNQKIGEECECVQCTNIKQTVNDFEKREKKLEKTIFSTK